MVHIEKFNETFIVVNTKNRQALEVIHNYFTFEVPGYQFMPAFKSGIWSGKIHLFNLNKQSLYYGLLQQLIELLKKENIDFVLSNDLQNNTKVNITASDWAKQTNALYEPRPYQSSGFDCCIKNNRGLVVMPTGSGKSFVIYLLAEWYKSKGLKTIIIVPLISLVDQMKSDIKEYSRDTLTTFGIKGGVKPEDYNDQSVVITTWQSVYKKPKEWFNQFGCIIGDEAHLFKSKSLTTILEKSTDIKYRFGFTGTLDGTKTHEMVLNGLFGSTYNIIKTKELIEKDVLANLKIQILQLNYQEKIKRMKYLDEVEFLLNHKGRNDFITKLAHTLKGNTLVLFSWVEKHGVPLYEQIRDTNTKPRPVYYVSGKVKSKDREEIRINSNNETNCIIVANYSVFSTGINIVNLHNIILASSTKSQVRVLQTIGRCLRKSYKDSVVYDIVDNLNKNCYSIKHANERNLIYLKQGFDFKCTKIKL